MSAGKIKCIFFSEFHPTAGPKVTFQVIVLCRNTTWSKVSGRFALESFLLSGVSPVAEHRLGRSTGAKLNAL